MAGNPTRATQPARPRSHPLAPLAQDWLATWLDTSGRSGLANAIRNATAPQAMTLIEELYTTLQDEVIEAVNYLIPEDDEVTEAVAVLHSSDYILASLPEAWLELVRETGRPGRIALVAQMSLFIELIRMAAAAEDTDLLVLEAACHSARETLAG